MAVANLTDMSILVKDAVFGERVAASLFQFCWSTVAGEAITASSLALHVARKNYASQILNSPQTYTPLFVNVVAANQTCANDATAAGTLVGLGSSQVAAAAAAVTDIDIGNAIAASFNAFIAGV